MDYTGRLNRFRDVLDGSIDLVFFPISADLHYLTGVPRDIPSFGNVMHPGSWLEGLWLSPHADPVLTLPRMTAEFGGISDASAITLRVLGDWDDPDTLVQSIVDGFNLPKQPRVATGERAHAETLIHLQALLPDATFHNATDLLRPLRVIKSEDEIATMRQAGAMTEAAFADVVAQLRHGMTENDLISEVNYQLRKHGSIGPSFPTAFYNSGPNYPLIFGKRLETMPRVLNPPVSILFDFGAVHEGYCYDFGRTVCFGAPDAEMQIVYDLVMASQAAGVAALIAGQNTTSDADAAARKVIEEAAYGEAFRHRLGHGIGMDVHEPPFLTAGDETPLQDGMLFTVEPSITQFNSYSARVEDVVVARPDGGEKLTSGFQSLIVID